MDKQRNILGGTLEACCMDPLTGFLRNGYCHTDRRDQGEHTVCAIMTEEFLNFSKSRGNDLSTPRPEFGFEGLKPGDSWCLCAARWLEAYLEQSAPPIKAEATNKSSLELIPLQYLLSHRLQ